LTLAARKEDEEVVKMLLGRVDILCLGWETPLTTAVQGRHEGVVKLLLARDDIDVNLKNKSRIGPLCIAVNIRAEAIVELLLLNVRLLVTCGLI
jgi:ankyrin repeat protein